MTVGHFEHSAVIHHGPEELAELIGPSLAAGAAAGDAFLVCLARPAADALRPHLADAEAVTFLPLEQRYTRPGVAMAALHTFVHTALEAGAPTAWSVGAIPFDGTALDHRWSRYESGVDAVLGHLPVRPVCSYDTATMPSYAIDVARGTHAAIVSCNGHSVPLPAPAGGRLAPDRLPDLLAESTSSRELRHLLATSFTGAMAPERLADLQLAASELITNATMHGAGPTRAAAWCTPEGVVLEVSDRGSGNLDPYADFRRLDRGAVGGYGLWMVGQLADEVTIDRRDGHTVVAARFC